MKTKIFVSLIYIIICIPASAQEWELSRDQENIKVYKGKSESSKFKIIKVEAELNGSLKGLIDILMDVSNNKNWVYHTKESHLVRKINENELLYYAETYLPWPFSNRDMVIRMHFELDSSNNILKVKATGEPDAIGNVQGKIRIPKFNGSWMVTYNGVNKIKIIYLLEVDPGGNVPASISNLFVTRGPFETFHNLSKLLNK